MSIENSIRRRDAADQIFRNDWSCRVGIWNYSSISTAVKGRNRLALERYDFRVFEINEGNRSVNFFDFSPLARISCYVRLSTNSTLF